MHRALILIVSVLALLAAQWWMAGRHDGAVFQGELFDSDSYMRLVRVQKLIQGDGWYDNNIARANAPHGHDLHWSRPLDVLLLAGAALLAPHIGWDNGLHQAGVWLSPLLHLLTLLALLWAARPLLGRQGLLWLGLLFPLQLFLDHQFAPGRPDHHALLLLLFVCAMGAQIRAMAAGGPYRAAWAMALALPLGLMVWVSVEGLVAVALAVALFILRWLWQGRAWTLCGLVLGAGLTVISGLAVVIEYAPGNWGSVAYDKISIPHVTLFTLLTCAFAIAGYFRPRWPGLIAFAAVPFFQFWAYPAFFQGPLAGQDAIFAAAIFQYAGEAAPLRTPGEWVLYLGPVLLALPIGLWRLQMPQIGWSWLVPTMGLAAYLPLAILQLRWAPYVALLALPGYSAALTWSLKALAPKPVLPAIFAAVLARTMVVLGFAFGFFLLSAILPGNTGEQTKCPYDAMARHLAKRFPAPQRILSYMTIAPAILYRSQHEVIATPYFRNTRGGRDGLAFFRATDTTAAFEIVRRRKVDLVLSCPRDRESRIYGPAQPMPSWLRALELPAELSQWYRLYRVQP
jgi:hypothetical protein